MIVTRSNFDEVIKKLSAETHLAVDTETTGLRPHHGDVLFSLIISSESDDFYFNFNHYEEVDDEVVLDEPRFWESLKNLFLDPFRTYFLHNAKFDLAFLRKEGVELAGKIHDTKTAARLIWNDHQRYSLKNCVKRDLDLEKSEAVEEYVKEHKLYEDIESPYKTTKERKVFYHRVPFDIITGYGTTDGSITFKLGKYQIGKIAANSRSKRYPPLSNVYELEKRLVRPMFDMEWYGIKIDREYCMRAIAHEIRLQQEAKNEFKRLTGKEFIDSNKLFSEIFDKREVPTTARGNPSFDKHSLEGMLDNPVARSITSYRDAKRQADYFNGFLYFADASDIIHPSFLADGTSSGRFSSQSPNLQNLTKPEEVGEEDSGVERFEVRGAFVPRPGSKFYIFDFQAQEYRLLVDSANAKEIAAKIRSGADVHAETAKKAGTTRHEAKVTLFSTLYGAGIGKLALTLKCSESHAKNVRNSILDSAPAIKKFLRDTIEFTEVHKFAFSWLGHIYQFPERSTAYRAPNYVIQGGCAAITKIALVNCYEYISRFKSRMVLTVHDSIVFEIVDGEEFLLSELKRLMVEAYPYNILPMDVSCELGIKNMAETEKIK